MDMSALNDFRRCCLSSVRSDARRINRRLAKPVFAILIAGVMCWCGGARAANVLINQGAETGDLTGWHWTYTGFISVVSTNQTVPGSTSNFLAHSGQYAFQLFDTTADSAILYQDFAAVAGSQWSASGYAICYASNYFNAGASAHLQLVFYDASNNVVIYPGAAGGTYTSDFLDPVDQSGSGVTWSLVPPRALDAGGWMLLQATNLNTTDPGSENFFDPTLVSLPLTAPSNTAFVRYQLEFDNAGTDGGAVCWDDCILDKLNFSDPDITNPPVSMIVYYGSPASFLVGATHTGAYPNEKLSYQWQYSGANLPAAGGVNNISGTTTTSKLSFTNLQSNAAGLYSVVVTVKSAAGNYTNSIRSVPVTLTVLCPCGHPLPVNRLGNPGFENAPDWSPWQPFNGCYFASTNSFYDSSTNQVNVFDGNWCALIGANGDRDNGLHQTVTGVAPGSVWKAGGWAYISSLNDFVAGNTCRIQVWFRDANGANLAAPTYESFKIYGLGYTNLDAQYTNIDVSSPDFGKVGCHARLPRDQWCYLAVTNMVNNGGLGLGDDLPYNTLPDGQFVAPANADQINFQVYEYCPVAGDNPQADLMGSASDEVYWDDMSLIQILPVTNLTASISATSVNLRFSARAGLSYAVLYKNTLSDPAWNVLTNVAAPSSWQTNVLSAYDTYPIFVFDALTSQSRFYRVQSK